MKRIFLSVLLVMGSPALAVSSTQSQIWSDYLDFAYVYTSAEPEALRERLSAYGAEAGVPLDRYIDEYFETLAPLEEGDDEAATRRKAIAYLLQYLASGDAGSLDASLRAVSELGPRMARHENRFWYHYIDAHRALEKGSPDAFVKALLDVWLHVVVPLEAPFATLETLSLSDGPQSGFVSALPYLYEDLARLILIRSQQLGMSQGLDPLSSLVRLLRDGRVGAYPDVIPVEASSKPYLDRIATRLEGPESDDGSLTFTLALFEASKQHEAARALLAESGLAPNTLKALRRAAGAYDTALRRARRVQGECAVYARVLRQLGEIYAAKQRLGADPELEIPFSIEGAIEVYAKLHGALEVGWEELGYRRGGRAAYLEAMRGLWEEIQEASLNGADYYLSLAAESPHRADAHSRSAARIYTRYLAFFERFATQAGQEAVPDSAYFAAFEAARGIGDAYLVYATDPRPAEIELATRRYRSALSLFPFDRELWPALTRALQRHGREGDYEKLVRPIADWVARSRAVDGWIANDEAHADAIAELRGALSDSLVLVYLGFADASGIERLEQDLAELEERRGEVEARLNELTATRDSLRSGAEVPAAPAEAPEPEPVAGGARPDLAQVAGELAGQARVLTRIEEQIAARSRALPLYKRALTTESFGGELRTRRDHTLHVLLRRMYHESRS